jgi:hypothetical protein
VILIAVRDAKKHPETRAWFQTADAMRVAALAGLTPESFTRVMDGVDWEIVGKPPRRSR